MLNLSHPRCGKYLPPTCVLLFVLGMLAWGSPWALAREVVVTMKDGQTLEGKVVERNPNQVVLSISGIRTPLARSSIKKIVNQPSLASQYRRRRSKLQANDLKGRYELAQWLFNKKAYDLARRELASLHQRFPENDRVITLARAVQAKARLDQQPKAAEPSGASASASAGGAAPRRGGQGQNGQGQAGRGRSDGQNLLSPDEMTLVKVWELPADLSDAQVGIQVPQKILRQIFEKYREDSRVPNNVDARRQLLGASQTAKLKFLFSLAARHPGVRAHYDEVRITGNPQAMVTFRRMIYPNYVQQYLRRMFGNGRVPGLNLVRDRRRRLAELYTNFYILSQLKQRGRRMIDRNVPADSLLVQWGLPRNSAKYPAPDVPGWRPFFTGTNDPNFQRFTTWIGSLYKNAGDYGINYTPTGSAGKSSGGSAAGQSQQHRGLDNASAGHNRANAQSGRGAATGRRRQRGNGARSNGDTTSQGGSAGQGSPTQ